MLLGSPIWAYAPKQPRSQIANVQGLVSGHWDFTRLYVSFSWTGAALVTCDSMTHTPCISASPVSDSRQQLSLRAPYIPLAISFFFLPFGPHGSFWQCSTSQNQALAYSTDTPFIYRHRNTNVLGIIIYHSFLGKRVIWYMPPNNYRATPALLQASGAVQANYFGLNTWSHILNTIPRSIVLLPHVTESQNITLFLHLKRLGNRKGATSYLEQN